MANRSISVYLVDLCSANKLIVAGVPQGLILCPYLFILFLNDIGKQSHTHLAISADDTASYSCSNDVHMFIGSSLTVFVEPLIILLNGNSNETQQKQKVTYLLGNVICQLETCHLTTTLGLGVILSNTWGYDWTINYTNLPVSKN